MQRHGGIALLLAAMALGSATGCAAVDEAPPSPAVQAALDTRISADVRAALGADPDLRGAAIDVATSAGIVRLSGFVGSAEDVAAAAAVARTVQGVQSIRNDLRLK
jgi:osmotically-inducible protein OsmY